MDVFIIGPFVLFFVLWRRKKVEKITDKKIEMTKKKTKENRKENKKIEMTAAKNRSWRIKENYKEKNGS